MIVILYHINVYNCNIIDLQIIWFIFDKSDWILNNDNKLFAVMDHQIIQLKNNASKMIWNVNLKKMQLFPMSISKSALPNHFNSKWQENTKNKHTYLKWNYISYIIVKLQIVYIKKFHQHLFFYSINAISFWDSVVMY